MPEEKTSQSPRTPMSPERDPLAVQMRLRGYFTEEQIQKFESIHPDDKYKFVLVEEGGIVKKEDGKPYILLATGQQMRDDIAIYKGVIASGDKRKTLEERQQAARELSAFVESLIEVPKDLAGQEREQVRREMYQERIKTSIQAISGHELYKKMYTDDGVIRKAELPTGRKSSSIIRDTQTMLAELDARGDDLAATPEAPTQGTDPMAKALAQADQQKREAGLSALSDTLNQGSEWAVAQQQSSSGLEVLLAKNTEGPALPKEVQKPAGQKTAALVP